MLNFHTSLSGLISSQVALDTIANNIANANSPGYHRQMVNLVTREPILADGRWYGTGVEVSRINQIASATIESSLTRNISLRLNSQQSLEIARQLEAEFSPGSGSIENRLESLFDELEFVQGAPDDLATRRTFLDQARSLAEGINVTADQLQQLQLDTATDARQQVDVANDYLESLVLLNRRIRAAVAAGQQPNDLRDQHQNIVNELAGLMDIQVVDDEGGYNYMLAGGTLSVHETDFSLVAEVNSNGQLEYRMTDNSFLLQVNGGKLAALQESHNSVIPGFQQKLEAFTRNLIAGFDPIHATGINLAGPHEFLNGSRSVEDLDTPLGQLDTVVGMQSGSLFISVEDQATGNRTLHEIVIDVDVHTARDVAAMISALPNVQGVANDQQSTISIIAEKDFGFDFAGRIQTVPDHSLVTGTATFELGGTYQGETNDQFQFEVIGTGTVGQDASLQLQVTNQAGEVVGLHNIGLDYEPGSTIALGNGVTVRVEQGTLNSGDTFSSQLVADPDTTNFLTAFGLGTLFQGNEAGSIGVNRQVDKDPMQLAFSRSGNIGDAANAIRMLQLRSQPASDGLTLGQRISSVTTEVAIEVDQLGGELNDLSLVEQQLVRQRDAVSGVDPNEEMVDMMRYQRAFEASVRVITTIDSLLADLMGMIR